MRGFVGRSATADAGGARRGEVGRHERLAARRPPSAARRAPLGLVLPRAIAAAALLSLPLHKATCHPPQQAQSLRRLGGRRRRAGTPAAELSGRHATAAAAAVIDGDAAEKIANKICRYVLLREHTRKPIPRKEIKDNTMSEQNDRSGKVFRQCLGVANDKLKELAGLELVALDAPPVEDDDGGAGGTQAAASQAAAGASQAAAMAKPQAAYILVNRLPEPYQTELDEMPAMYQAFIEVILSFIQQSDGELTEERLFGYLEQIGLERDKCLPQPAEQTNKVGELVQKRMVNEAWLRRTKKAGGAEETYVYVAGARAVLSRSVDRADELRNTILGGA